MNAKTDIAVVDDPPTPSQLLQLAVEGGADPEQVKQLMDLQERWEANQARKAYVRAMTAFKANPPTLIKTAKASFEARGGRTEYTYVTLAAAVAVITPALSMHGLTHRWSTDQSNGIAVTCVLTHEGGHSESETQRAEADTTGSKNSIQAIGSAITYLQRYTLTAITGLAAGDQDDDGYRAIDQPMLTVEQKNAIVARQKAVAPDSTKGFLKALGVETLDLLPASRYDEAMRRLDEKARAAS